MGFDDKDIEPLKMFFPTTKKISNLNEVRQSEWDVLITKGAFVSPEQHLFVLSFGRANIENIQSSGIPDAYSVSGMYGKVEDGSLATEFIIPDDLPPDLARLVMNELVPKLNDEDKHIRLGVGSLMRRAAPVFSGYWNFNDINEVKGVEFKLFVGTHEPSALAGCFVLKGGLAEAWMLPFVHMDVAAWVEVALKQWHKLAPERFPVDLGWERNPEWMTRLESELVGKIDVIRKERQKALAYFDSIERELKTQLHAANLSADTSERRLLTTQGDVLVEAVADALKELGFSVEDMDKIFPKNDRREDLRVGLPEDKDWVAICEIKGYFKGAAVNDLLKIERFRGRFFKEKGREPERCWYVVNSFLKDDPARRGRALAANSAEVETFAEGGGLVVGTVELFRLQMKVRAGKIEAKEARRLLADRTGVFTLDLGG
ncbi:MAG: hypothetical protein ACJ8AN_17385 [Archangium sp.]